MHFLSKSLQKKTIIFFWVAEWCVRKTVLLSEVVCTFSLNIFAIEKLSVSHLFLCPPSRCRRSPRCWKWARRCGRRTRRWPTNQRSAPGGSPWRCCHLIGCWRTGAPPPGRPHRPRPRSSPPRAEGRRRSRQWLK